MYSSRVSESNASTAPPGAGKIVSDAEYKDTVLYLQQRQSLNHQEVMAAIRDVAAKLSTLQMGSGVNVSPAQASRPVPELIGSGSPYAAALGLSDAEQGSLTGSRYAAYLVSPSSAPNTQTLRDSELDAARSRITSLEAQVKSLKEQLESKEATIRRLSDAALRDVVGRVGAASSSLMKMPGAAPSALRQLQQPRAVVQHRDVADLILSLGELTPGASDTLRGANGRTALGSARDALELHDRRCQQLLSAAPYAAMPLTDADCGAAAI
jgi:hypothetical protein